MRPDSPPKHLRRLQDSLIAIVLRVLTELQADPQVNISLVSYWWSSAQNTATGRLFHTLNLQLTSNAPDIVRGSVSLLEEGGTVGFNTVYLRGFVDAFLARGKHDLTDQVLVNVDVLPVASGELIVHPRYVPVSRALATGLIGADSPMAAYCRKYGLETISIYGPSIIGPSTEMIAALERVWPSIKPASVLDLFSGTGALAKVCCKLGAIDVRTIDVAPAVQLDCMPADAFAFSFDATAVDLALVDQFIEHTVVVGHKIIPRLNEVSRYVMWNLGYSGFERTYRRLIEDIAPLYRAVDWLLINDCFIVLLSK